MHARIVHCGAARRNFNLKHERCVEAVPQPSDFAARHLEQTLTWCEPAAVACGLAFGGAGGGAGGGAHVASIAKLLRKPEHLT